jgi:hypothetical protein
MQSCVHVATSWVAVTLDRNCDFRCEEFKYVFVQYLYKHNKMYTASACTVRSFTEWYLKENLTALIGIKERDKNKLCVIVRF